MHIRRTFVAVCAALSLSATVAYADTSAGNTKKEPPKGKPGASCKKDADCDQSSGPQICSQSKCQEERIPPPT
jgi:uncharacterized membrane protein